MNGSTRSRHGRTQKMNKHVSFIAFTVVCVISLSSLAQGVMGFQGRRIPNDIALGVALDISDPMVRQVFRISNVEYDRGASRVLFSYFPKDKLDVGDAAVVRYSATAEDGVVKGIAISISIVADVPYGEKLRRAANLFELNESLYRGIYGSAPPVEVSRSDNLVLAEKVLGRNAKESDKVVWALGSARANSTAQVIFMDGRQTRFNHFTVSVNPAMGYVAFIQSEILID